MTPLERFKILRENNLCYQCLFPGAKCAFGKHKDGQCQRDYACKHPLHDRYTRKKHVLVCHDHCESEDNKKLLQEYKDRCILRQKVDLPSYAKEIKLSFHVGGAQFQSTEISGAIDSFDNSIVDEPVITESATYMLQTLLIDGNLYTLFFDTGCGDMVCSINAIRKLGSSRVSLQYPGPINIVLENTKSVHGVYQDRLPLNDIIEVRFAGVCLDKLTNDFPMYPLDGKVTSDIHQAFIGAGGNIDNLPKLPKTSWWLG